MRQEKPRKMRTSTLEDGKTKIVYDSEEEYNLHGREFYREHGKRQITYEGWLKDELVRIF